MCHKKEMVFYNGNTPNRLPGLYDLHINRHGRSMHSALTAKIEIRDGETRCKESLTNDIPENRNLFFLFSGILNSFF